MKKGILFLAVLCIAVSLGGSPVSAEDFKWPGAASASDFEFHAKSGLIARYLGKGGVVVIPDSINGAAVKGIQSNAFNETDKAEHVTEVKIPAGAKDLKPAVFYNCPELTRVEIPEGVTAIPDSFIYMAKKMTEVTIPQSVTSIGNFSFFACDALTTVHFPAGLKTIGESAFSSGGFTALELPDSVEVIGKSAFSSCYKLKIVKFPANLKEIGDGAFTASAMESLELPDGVEKIGAKAFNFSGALKTVKLPAGLKMIGDSAFEGNSAMQVPALPQGLESIGAKAFAGCKWTRSVVLPASVKSIGSGAFMNEKGTLWELCVSHVHEPSQMPELVRKEGAPAVFADVSQLSMAWDATLAQTSAMDAWLAGKGEEQIAWVMFNPEWAQYVNFDALPLERIEEGKTLARVAAHKAGEPGEKVAIPRDNSKGGGDFLYISEIGNGAFKGQNISFFGAYASVARIGAEAFADCKELKEVYLPISLETIGERAFANSGLRRLVIPESVKEVHQTAFAGCTDLESVTLPKGLEKLRASHFTFEWSADAGKFSGPTKTISGTGVTLSYPEGTKAEFNPVSKAPTVKWARDEAGVFVDTKFSVYAERSKTPNMPYDEQLAKLLERKKKDQTGDSFRVFERIYKGHRCIVVMTDTPEFSEASTELRIYPKDGSHVFIAATGDISSVTLADLMNPDVIAVMNSAAW